MEKVLLWCPECNPWFWGPVTSRFSSTLPQEPSLAQLLGQCWHHVLIWCHIVFSKSAYWLHPITLKWSSNWVTWKIWQCLVTTHELLWFLPWLVSKTSVFVSAGTVALLFSKSVAPETSIGCSFGLMAAGPFLCASVVGGGTGVTTGVPAETSLFTKSTWIGPFWLLRWIWNRFECPGAF